MGESIGNIIVRDFTMDMLDQCVDLYMKTYSREPWNESWSSRGVVVDFFTNHHNNNYFIGYVAMVDGEIAAVSMGFAKPWIKGMEYYIDDFFVDADRHRQGIGSRFMAEIKKDLLSRDIHAIFLNTERGIPAQAFYESVGFSVEKDLIILDTSF